MSYQVSLDQDEPIQLASNQGYYDYCDWIESLDPVSASRESRSETRSSAPSPAFCRRTPVTLTARFSGADWG